MTPKKKRWLLYPGMVTSQTDGQRHHVPASRLPQLFGVDPAECVIARPDVPGWKPPSGLTALAPRSNGDYTLPEVE